MQKLIYILEDNDEIREILELLLVEDDYRVSAFANVSSFLIGLSLQVPDTFILDVMLPDGNGIDICRKLKEDERTSNVPVVMMSANYNQEQLASSCPAQDFISKPFDIADFSNRIAIQTRANVR